VSWQVWKYQVPISGCVEHEIPFGAQILCVQMRRCRIPGALNAKELIPTVWALVNPETPKARYRFWVVGTGHDFPNHADCHYVGTVQHLDPNGPADLVFHVFVDPFPSGPPL
jgi:hypothetical protein